MSSQFFRVCFFFGLLSLCSALYAQQEICNNLIDDDKNGLTDCEDRECYFDAEACPAYAKGSLSCPVAGELPDIVGAGIGFKDDNLSLDTIKIARPTAAQTLRLVLQGNFEGASNPDTMVFENNPVEWGDDRLIYGIIDIDLETNVSSGMVEYLMNNWVSTRYVWQKQPLGVKTDQFQRKGGRFDRVELENFEFLFDADQDHILIVPFQTDIQISAFATFYGNPEESMIKMDSDKLEQPFLYFESYVSTPISESIEQSIPLPEEDFDFILIRSLGINQIRGDGVENWMEEGNYRTEMMIDVKAREASGILTISSGQDTLAGSNYAFSNYDVTSGEMILQNADIIGDTVGRKTGLNQLGLANLGITLEGKQLTLTRDSLIARDFNEIYVIEVLQNTGLPYGAGFSVIETEYLNPDMHSYATSGTDSVDYFLNLKIPDGSRRVTFLTAGNGIHKNTIIKNPEPRNGNYLNENQVITYADLDLFKKTHTGYNGFLATSGNQQLYAWQDVAMDLDYDFAKSGDITGQNPTSSDRIFWGITNDTLSAKIRNSAWTFERNILVRFDGSLPDLIPGNLTQNAQSESCDSLFFQIELCNGGGAFLSPGEGLSINLLKSNAAAGEEPQIQASAKLNIDLPPGKCQNYDIAFAKDDIPSQSDKIWIEVNGTAARANVNECSFSNNLDSAFYQFPVVVEGSQDVGDVPVCRIPPGFIKEALMEDSDLDGVADKLTITYERNLNVDGLPDEVVIYWPNEGTEIKLTQDEIKNAQVGNTQLVVEQEFPGLPVHAETGMPFVSSRKAEDDFRSVPIHNSLSLYLTSAIISVDETGGYDTLLVRLSEAPYEESLKNSAFLLNAALIEYVDIIKVDSLNWRLVLAHDQVNHGDKLTLNDEVVRDVDLNLVGFNPQVTVIEQGRVLALSTDANLFVDQNEDGTMDGIVLTLEREIDPEKILPWELNVFWPNAEGELKTYRINETTWTRLDADENADNLVYFVDVQDSSVKRMQTSLQDFESGVGHMIINVSEESSEKDTLSFSMGDGMAPVPIQARLLKQEELDTVKILYTESIQVPETFDSLYNLHTEMGYFLSTPVYAFTPQEQPGLVNVIYSNKMSMSEIFPGDSVQAAVSKNSIQDLYGNSVGEKSRWRVLTGTVPLGEEFGGVIYLQNEFTQADSAFSLIPVDRSITVADLKSEKNFQGLFIEGRMQDLMGEGVMAILPDSIRENLSPSDYSLNYQIFVYSSIGQYVAEFSGELKCDDALFNGDCNSSANSSNVLLRWNQRSQNGRKVGTGAYIIKYDLTAKVLKLKNNKKGRYSLGVVR